MNSPYTVHQLNDAVVVEMHLSSLMDPGDLDDISSGLRRLTDEQHQRKIILDFSQVDYISSPAINIILGLHRRLSGPTSGLALCRMNATLLELLQRIRLDRVFHIRPTLQEAMAFLTDQ